MKNDTLPGPCVFCGKDKKPSFVEYYCDCRDEEVTERMPSEHNECIHGNITHDCQACAYQSNLLNNGTVSSVSQTPIYNVQFHQGTNWCGAFVALTYDPDPVEADKVYAIVCDKFVQHFASQVPNLRDVRYHSTERIDKRLGSAGTNDPMALMSSVGIKMKWA